MLLYCFFFEKGIEYHELNEVVFMSSSNNFDYEYNKYLLTSHHEGLQKKLIEDAYEFARAKHYGQTRKTNEPYDQHPIKVALKLNELHADYETICAALWLRYVVL